MSKNGYDWSAEAEAWARDVLGPEDIDILDLPAGRVTARVEVFEPDKVPPAARGYTFEESQMPDGTDPIEDDLPLFEVPADDNPPAFLSRRLPPSHVTPPQDEDTLPDADTFVFSGPERRIAAED